MQDERMDPSCWGFQLIIDCFGCDFDACCDLDNGYEFLDRICDHLHMTKQTQPYIFKTCESAFPGRPGYSGWVPIIESGIQIHTSAHNRFISVDVYSCKPFDISDVVAFTQRWFKPVHVDTAFLQRGKDYKKHGSLTAVTTA
ncbi:MAG: S-adenosylmethionine decarboxylase [Acidobacteriota bacterium]